MHLRVLRKGIGTKCGLRTTLAAMTIAILTMVVASPAARAQTYTIIHEFTGGADGGGPIGGLTIDATGNLYGTTAGYAPPCGAQCGNVFKMRRDGQNWVVTPLYKFTGGTDGASPEATVVFGPDGALYGTTVFGGSSCASNQNGCGTVFRLAPQPHNCAAASCPWTESVLYSFVGGSNDGALPYAKVAFDQAGNLYGTTYEGGVYTTNCYYGHNWCGTIFELTHSHGNWTESLPHIFTGGSDGANPVAALIPDAAGNFYGVADANGTGNGGTLFQLAPSGSGWNLNTLFAFGNVSFPRGDLIFDPAGNLYGTTEFGGNGVGSVFEASPSGGGWNVSQLYSLSGFLQDGPVAGVVRDSAGNLYGTGFELGSGNAGIVFKLTPSNGGYTYTLLHEFGGAEGAWPTGDLVLDAQGNLYGIAAGGTHSWGLVWEITP